MKIRIENGITIISTSDSIGGRKNKTGHAGVTYCKKQDRYRADIGYKSKQYLLGYYTYIDDAIAIRKEAEQQKANDTFLQWYNSSEKLRRNKHKIKNR